MDSKLTQIDDAALEQVSGGVSISINPGKAIDTAVDTAVGVVKGTVNFVGGAVKEVVSWLPTISIRWGR